MKKVTNFFDILIYKNGYLNEFYLLLYKGFGYSMIWNFECSPSDDASKVSSRLRLASNHRMPKGGGKGK